MPRVKVDTVAARRETLLRGAWCHQAEPRRSGLPGSDGARDGDTEGLGVWGAGPRALLRALDSAAGESWARLSLPEPQAVPRLSQACHSALVTIPAAPTY